MPSVASSTLVPSPPSEARLIAERLRAARTRKDLEIQDVASSLRVSRDTVWSWETGRTSPRALDLLRLCDLYDCSADQLLGRGQDGPFTLIDEKAEHRAITATTYKVWQALAATFSVTIHSRVVVVTDPLEYARRVERVLEVGEALRKKESRGVGKGPKP